MTALPATLAAELRQKHEHTCPEHGQPMADCEADVDDPHEVGVCASWDALRDVADLGYRAGLEAAAACCERNAELLTNGRRMVATFLAEEIRALGKEGV